LLGLGCPKQAFAKIATPRFFVGKVIEVMGSEFYNVNVISGLVYVDYRTVEFVTQFIHGSTWKSKEH
jgi:hypothetical protein